MSIETHIIEVVVALVERGVLTVCDAVTTPGYDVLATAYIEQAVRAGRSVAHPLWGRIDTCMHEAPPRDLRGRILAVLVELRTGEGVEALEIRAAARAHASVPVRPHLEAGLLSPVVSRPRPPRRPVH